MGVQAVGNLPLNHYFNEIPEKSASSLRCKALALNVLEKISWVAFLAIMATIFTVSYAGISLTGNLPLILVAMVLFTPIFAVGASQFNIMSSGYAQKAAIEEGVTNELKLIAKWKTPEIEQFIREQGLHLDLIPLDALKQKNENEPLCALLPLIARFNFLHRLENDTERASKEKLAHRIEDEIAEAETEREKPIEESQKRLIRLANRQIAWRQHELEAIPRGLDAAVMLHIIQNPTLLDLTLTKIGEFRAKSYDERMFDRHFAPINDEYFAFHKDLHRPSLTLAEIEQDMAPRALRLKLFPLAIRI